MFLRTLIFFLFSLAASADDRLKELDAYWTEVSRTVKEGDFKDYKATCHPDGVLISGKKNTATPLAAALVKWKPGFLDTKAGKMKASVDFRFSRRLGDATTAYEIGIFRYSSTDASGKTTTVYVHLEATLIKKDKWLVIVENQKGEATKAEWDDLASPSK